MATISYGLDYSAGELTPAQLSAISTYDISFLIRYCGWPANRKCISHYPGAYARHVAAGRTVLLVAEGGTTDPAGGFAAGVAMARRALDDATSMHYPEALPIFFCADGWLADKKISVATAMSYLDGAASIVGRARVGAYGFRDFVRAARDQNKAPTRWLCGAAPSDDEVNAGLCHYYQWNGGSIMVGGFACDVNWSYVPIPISKESIVTPSDAAVAELLDLARTLVFQLVTGDAAPGAAMGWESWPGGTDERLTVVDYLRRANTEVCALHGNLAAAHTKLDALADRLTQLESTAPGGSASPICVTVADQAAIAAATSVELSRRLGVK